MRVVLISIIISISILACEQKVNEQEEQKEQVIKEIVEHYPDGVKKIEGKEVNGVREGKWIYYYENGFIWSQGEFKNGKRTGYSIVYHENGNTKIEGNYEDGLKVGVWKFWNSDGSLSEERDFDVDKDETVYPEGQ